MEQTQRLAGRFGWLLAWLAVGFGPACASSHTCPSAVEPSFGVSSVAAADESSRSAPETCARPRLIVQLTVDQLSAGLLKAASERFGSGGFRRLLQEGVRYEAAHYRHAVTETAPGHATLATGADPADHGIVANEWYDPAQATFVYNAADADSPLLGADGAGRSVRLLQGSTLADELVWSQLGRARAFAVSIKDRGAIFTAGRAGTPFWYDKKTGRFITSRHYVEALPDWVERFNASEPWRAYAGASWEPLQAARDSGRLDDRACERGVAGWGASFPHPYGTRDDPQLFARLPLSPAGDALTLAFVRALLDAHDLGAREQTTDYLAVSFSSTDYVGHHFGPDSLEALDNLLRLDALLAELFELLDARVGLAHTWVVLSADHGAAASPEWMGERGLVTAGRRQLGSDDLGAVRAHVRARTGKDVDLIAAVRAPYVWLDAGAVERAKLSPERARLAVAEAFMQLDGVRVAYTREQLADASETTDASLARARRSFHRERSGDVHLIPEPYFLFAASPDEPPLTASHGSPWAYDTHVPLIVWGRDLAPLRVWRPVGPHAIAPSLAQRIGARLPSGANAADLLHEVLRCAP